MNRASTYEPITNLGQCKTISLLKKLTPYCGDVDALTIPASMQGDYVPIRATASHGPLVLEYLERSARRHVN